MPEKKLPLALIGAFFVIGVLLGLLFIDSDSYRQLSDDMRASLHDSGAALQENRKASGDNTVKQALSGGASSTGSRTNEATGAAKTETFLCDPASAEAIRNKARSIAEISETADGVLNVRLREQWAYYTPGIRKSFLQAFAESDTCLLGHSRLIHFYYNGEEIAISKPASGLTVE